MTEGMMEDNSTLAMQKFKPNFLSFFLLTPAEFSDLGQPALWAHCVSDNTVIESRVKTHRATASMYLGTFVINNYTLQAGKVALLTLAVRVI